MTKSMDHDFKKADLVLRLHRKEIIFLCDAINTEAVLTLFGSQKPGPELVEEGTWLRVVVTALSLSLSLSVSLLRNPFSPYHLLFQSLPGRKKG